MEIIIGAVVFGLIVIAIIVMVIINFTYRSIKKRREDMEDDHYQHLKQKEQKEKHPFGKDYFKSAAPKKQQPKARPASQSQQEQPKQQEQPRQQTAGPKYQKETARKTVTTDGKVTIFDDRKKSDKRKIFNDKDGEYVEFEEIKP
jgi:cytoskeletal protein RodZ